MPVIEDLMLVQARWRAPLAVAEVAGCLPRLRILACNSTAPSPHLLAASSNTVFNRGFVTAFAHVRKPCSPSLVVSSSVFSVPMTLSMCFLLSNLMRSDLRFPTASLLVKFLPCDHP